MVMKMIIVRVRDNVPGTWSLVMVMVTYKCLKCPSFRNFCFLGSEKVIGLLILLPTKLWWRRGTPLITKKCRSNTRSRWCLFLCQICADNMCDSVLGHRETDMCDWTLSGGQWSPRGVWSVDQEHSVTLLLWLGYRLAVILQHQWGIGDMNILNHRMVGKQEYKFKLRSQVLILVMYIHQAIFLHIEN